jgi:hypothetical protein
VTDAAGSITAEEIAAAIGRPVAMVRRRTWEYHTSHPMQELHVELTDGSTFDLLLKDLAPDRQLPEARRTRPAFIYNPRREIDVYREVLSRAPNLDTPAFYGAAIDQRRESERYWLFIECVRGVPLWQCELDAWPAAARWLRTLHAQRLESLPPSLLRHDAAFYARWIERAAKFRPTELRPIEKNYRRVIDRLVSIPPAFIHGEFYPSNVLVQDGHRIRAVDWETAAVGPGLIDLAALAGGEVDDDVRRQLAREYGAVDEDLDFCRLHLAVQWLGWSEQWTPPREHAHDWLAETIALAKKLGIA